MVTSSACVVYCVVLCDCSLARSVLEGKSCYERKKEENETLISLALSTTIMGLDASWLAWQLGGGVGFVEPKIFYRDEEIESSR